MVLKKCPRCGGIYNPDNFSKSLKTYCLLCVRELSATLNQKNRSSHDRFLNVLWYSMTNRLRNNRYYENVSRNFTKDEFLKFGLKNQNYKKLHHDWVKSHFNRNLTPTVDRIKKGNYALDNIQFLTMYDNSIKGNGKKVLCINTGRIYNSVKEASIKNKIPDSTIGAICRGEIAKPAGLTFMYI